jgi:hypothetical protein
MKQLYQYHFAISVKPSDVLMCDAAAFFKVCSTLFLLHIFLSVFLVSFGVEGEFFFC